MPVFAKLALAAYWNLHNADKRITILITNFHFCRFCLFLLTIFVLCQSVDGDYTIVERTLSLPNNDGIAKYLLYVPSKAIESERRPLVISLYGAGGSLANYNFGGPEFEDLRNELDRRKYFVIIPDLGPWHCMNDRAMRVLDLLIADLPNDSRIDGDCLHLFGTSMGGGSALAYALHQPHRIRSVVSHLGMTDFADWITENPDYQDPVRAAFGGTPKEVPNTYRERSAIANARRLKDMPVMLIHGTKDDVVRPEHSMRLHKALQLEHGTSVLKLVEGGAHSNATMSGLSGEVADFFDAACDSKPRRAEKP